MVLTKIWYKQYPECCLASLTGTRFSSLSVSVLKPRRGYVCLQSIMRISGNIGIRNTVGHTGAQ